MNERCHLPRALSAILGLSLLAACSSTVERPPPGEQDATIVIKVPGVTSVASEKQRYDCGDLTVDAEYINAAGVSLATLKFDDDFLVMSNVISGSGARYAGNQYIWWSKGDEASFENLMQAEKKPLQCKALS